MKEIGTKSTSIFLFDFAQELSMGIAKSFIFSTVLEAHWARNVTKDRLTRGQDQCFFFVHPAKLLVHPTIQ